MVLVAIDSTYKQNVAEGVVIVLKVPVNVANFRCSFPDDETLLIQYTWSEDMLDLSCDTFEGLSEIVKKNLYDQLVELQPAPRENPIGSITIALPIPINVQIRPSVFPKGPGVFQMKLIGLMPEEKIVESTFSLCMKSSSKLADLHVASK